jgi:hypothetical protein
MAPIRADITTMAYITLDITLDITRDTTLDIIPSIIPDIIPDIIGRSDWDGDGVRGGGTILTIHTIHPLL